MRRDRGGLLQQQALLGRGEVDAPPAQLAGDAPGSRRFGVVAEQREPEAVLARAPRRGSCRLLQPALLSTGSTSSPKETRPLATPASRTRTGTAHACDLWNDSGAACSRRRAAATSRARFPGARAPDRPGRGGASPGHLAGDQVVVLRLHRPRDCRSRAPSRFTSGGIMRRATRLAPEAAAAPAHPAASATRRYVATMRMNGRLMAAAAAAAPGATDASPPAQGPAPGRGRGPWRPPRSRRRTGSMRSVPVAVMPSAAYVSPFTCRSTLQKSDLCWPVGLSGSVFDLEHHLLRLALLIVCSFRADVLGGSPNSPQASPRPRTGAPAPARRPPRPVAPRCTVASSSFPRTQGGAHLEVRVAGRGPQVAAADLGRADHHDLRRAQRGGVAGGVQRDLQLADWPAGMQEVGGGC
jgi:hypothetical protein